ncbi:DUF3791 domain-containing protein [uncultured Duncaniella sp.]|uniref:DUF3791 domain-containing protein n=1 Tax=uncultured Duncaniella sp. TaxID=2768039 RepID=UPI0025AA3079|nr:DUF3791 domain-containing protein [uncultured Duncaniella sp.]
MTEESNLAFHASKSANIIKSLSDLYGLSLQEAADIYYQSDTSELIEDGIADLHCRSDKYLATVIWEEHQESRK